MSSRRTHKARMAEQARRKEQIAWLRKECERLRERIALLEHAGDLGLIGTIQLTGARAALAENQRALRQLQGHG